MKMRMAAVVLSAVIAASPVWAGEKMEFTSEKEKLSYALGVNIGGKLKYDSLEDVDVDILAKGIKDAFSGNDGMTLQESKDIIIAAQDEMRARKKELLRVAAEDFLAANKEKEGVKTLPSGLQYKVIVEGKGKSPKANDTVTASYRGTLIDGTEFDRSQEGKPPTFPVKGVIKGWAEALQLMKEGDKWQLFIPPSLAYGDTGRQGIPANAVLIFDVELISVKKAAKQGAKHAPKQAKPAK